VSRLQCCQHRSDFRTIFRQWRGSNDDDEKPPSAMCVKYVHLTCTVERRAMSSVAQRVVYQSLARSWWTNSTRKTVDCTEVEIRAITGEKTNAAIARPKMQTVSVEEMWAHASTTRTHIHTSCCDHVHWVKTSDLTDVCGRYGQSCDVWRLSASVEVHRARCRRAHTPRGCCTGHIAMQGCDRQYSPKWV